MGRTIVASMLALSVLALGACTYTEGDYSPASERGIDSDIRATNDAGSTLRNVDRRDEERRKAFGF
jgi:hypothetical protein